MSDLSEFRELLESTVVHWTRWRENQAERFPNDAPNKEGHHCIKLLERLAVNLKAVPAEDPRLYRLWHMQEALLERDTGIELSEETSDFIGHYGFDGPQDGNAGQFIDNLVGLHSELLPVHHEEGAA